MFKGSMIAFIQIKVAFPGKLIKTCEKLSKKKSFVFFLVSKAWQEKSNES
jgi:hypothetical protein